MTGVTDVIIFFVGLTLWSEQLPNDCGVKAVLPRVQTTPNTAAMLSRHVEDHVAAIIFPAESYVRQKGWVEPSILESGIPATTATSGGFKYVVLDGDTVRFITDGATNVPASLNGVTLPHLQQEICPARQTLNGDYQLPYSGAAAVVVLPQGKLKTCLSLPEESEGRLDTQLELSTTGTLVISASTMRKEKELHLESPDGRPIEVMIANVPAAYFHGGMSEPARNAINGMSHENAYYAMSGPSTNSCVSLSDWWNQLQYPDGIVRCNARTSAAFTPTTPIILTSVSTSAANFECSNIRWP